MYSKKVHGKKWMSKFKHHIVYKNSKSNFFFKILVILLNV